MGLTIKQQLELVRNAIDSGSFYDTESVLSTVIDRFVDDQDGRTIDAHELLEIIAESI